MSSPIVNPWSVKPHMFEPSPETNLAAICIRCGSRQYVKVHYAALEADLAATRDKLRQAEAAHDNSLSGWVDKVRSYPWFARGDELSVLEAEHRRAQGEIDFENAAAFVYERGIVRGVEQAQARIAALEQAIEAHQKWVLRDGSASRIIAEHVYADLDVRLMLAQADARGREEER